MCPKAHSLVAAAAEYIERYDAWWRSVMQGPFGSDRPPAHWALTQAVRAAWKHYTAELQTAGIEVADRWHYAHWLCDPEAQGEYLEAKPYQPLDGPDWWVALAHRVKLAVSYLRYLDMAPAETEIHERVLGVGDLKAWATKIIKRHVESANHLAAQSGAAPITVPNVAPSSLARVHAMGLSASVRAVDTTRTEEEAASCELAAMPLQAH